MTRIEPNTVEMTYLNKRLENTLRPRIAWPDPDVCSFSRSDIALTPP